MISYLFLSNSSSVFDRFIEEYFGFRSGNVLFVHPVLIALTGGYLGKRPPSFEEAVLLED